MRIALVDNSRGWGGAEEILLAIAKGLKSRGHHVGLFLREGSVPVEKFVQVDLSVWPISRKGFGVLSGIIEMIGIVRREKFDLIHVHRNHDLPVGKVVSYFAGGKPLLLTQHCVLSNTSFFLLNLADRISAVSKYIADDISARFPGLKDKLCVVHNGIDLDSFAHPRGDYWSNREELAGKGPLLGVVGYFYKNQEELVELLPRIRSVFPGVMLIIIGHDAGKIDGLKRKVSAAGVADSVYFAGNIPHDEMKHALASLDLNISAFRKEGFGLSVIEGMAVGTPFVGYRAGGYREIVENGITGYLVENQDELVDILIKALSNKASLDLLSRNAIVDVKTRFTINAMLDNYELMYEEQI